MRPMQAGDLNTLRAIDSALEGHPNPAEGFPFFDAATGSLGQGLSVAAGLASSAAGLAAVAGATWCAAGLDPSAILSIVQVCMLENSK